MQEILTFHPIYKETIWGGDRLSKIFRRELPSKKIGESWEISAYGKDVSIIKTGTFAGKSLTEIFANWRVEIFGKALLHLEEFPLLV
ncbi:MAG: mannose-6-phosphate isomerase, partial [Candidatus Omnitrophica bacterium]|nr:mannose-6-phosphate isomerase [Candidatus Omnitrophota bacterium]